MKKLAKVDQIVEAQLEAETWVKNHKMFYESTFIAKRAVAEFILNKKGYTMFTDCAGS